MRIVSSAPELKIKAVGGYEVFDVNSGKRLFAGQDLDAAVFAGKSGLVWPGENINTDSVFIKPGGSAEILINNRRYRGGVRIIRKSSLGLSAVNYLGLEDYVKGIAVREVSHYWPAEALKAQAIVFRTFALYQIEQNKNKDFDVTSDVYSQVYGGKQAERYRINDAVDQTKNEVLVYKGKIFPAFYHSTCAGHTEDASLLWDINIPPLKGVACYYCGDSPHFSWRAGLNKAGIRDSLVKAGYKINRVKSIRVLQRDRSNRAIDLQVDTDAAGIKMQAKDFRNIIGPDIIRSANFTVKPGFGGLEFSGLGWGHGVGLCQWGAYFQAKLGGLYRDILGFYYPDSEIVSLTSLSPG
ncbi:MAG: SpoIID/LytB domain-containing protein [Candidatus Omnitrophica bacterium]|nr:SpoIID/LytB domain-containing protein [Candidatus Omnitrophota bacterium]MDD5079471.1 SpoIID/LytB domain-containing protein [Candidatus Omnitrophota bacterium]